MRTRSYQPEILDESDGSAEDVRISLDFIRGINRRYGGIPLILDFFERHARGNNFTVLDLGTGAGDIPDAIVKWARKRSQEASVTAVDTNPHCLEYARKRHGSEAITYLECSAFDIAGLGSFDFITSSLFFHHLNDEEAVSLLRMMDRQSRKGFIVNDLYRGWIPYLGALLLTLLTGKKIVINDGPLSVKRAFREADLRRYAELAGLKNFEIRRNPVYRISLSCTK